MAISTLASEIQTQIKSMARVYLSGLLMVEYTKVIGKMIYKMAGEDTYLVVVPVMKDSG